MNKLRRSVTILLLLCTPLAVFAQRDLRPVDEAALQPDFFSFRAQLQAAVARRDVSAILSVLHKDVKNSFGGDGGIEEFKAMWELPSPTSRLWETLATVLALGGTFGPDSTFTAPYTYSRWPHELDPFSHMVAIVSSVRVRANASASSAVTASLTFSIVELPDTKTMEAPWVQVRLPGGRVGFVDRRLVRSPLDYRAIFERQEGKWLLTAFIAGD
jgi:hypothetical protein